MEPNKQNPWLTLICVAVGSWLILSDNQGGGCTLPAIPSIVAPAKVTAVTYVRDEKAPVPAGVTAALAELNTKGIIASEFPDDATDGDGDVPDQYKITLPAARAAGIPSLVVQAGDKVLRTVAKPTTKEQVLEAAK